jgi:hypothetical protein
MLHAHRQAGRQEVDADVLVAQQREGHRSNEDHAAQHVGDVERPQGRRIEATAYHHLIAHDDDEERRHDHRGAGQDPREPVDARK